MPPRPESLLAALSIELRRALEGPVDTGTGVVSGDLGRRLAALGIRRGSAIVEEGALPPLSAEDRAARRMAEAFIAQRRDSGVSADAAITELTGEAAYAWAIRLLSLRCLEARGLSSELPAIVDPPLPALALRPSAAAMDRCRALLSGKEQVKGEEPATDATFRGSDALGWAYQAWNNEEKIRLFEAIRVKKIAKVGGADVIPATCIYTQAHLVKFLVQNSLGALFRASHPASRLHERWPFHVEGADPPPGPRKAVRELRFLDPACGSGNFLLEAFDLFHAMYLDEGEIIDPEAICASIFEHNLHGIDIDERAVQIAALSLLMRAREIAPGFVPTRLNLVATNLDVPAARAALQAFLTRSPGDASSSHLFDALDHVSELGFLVRFLEAPEQALDRLASQLDDSGSSQDARKALALIAMLGRRYDVVCMNPPYIGFRKLAVYLKDRVTEDALATLDLYVAFLSRSFSLLCEGGCLAAVTPSSWTTSSKTLELRRRMLAEGGPRIVVSLGQRVFESAPLLFVSLSVIYRGKHPSGGTLVTLRPPSLSFEAGLLRAAQRADKRWPHAILRSLETLPFFPVAPLPLLRKAREQPSVQDFFTFADGVWTGSNDRDFREAWEVGAHDPGWVPTSGGQGYARWYAPFARRMRARDGRAWPAYEARSFALEYSRVAGGKLCARLVRAPSLAIAGIVSLLPRPGADPRRLFETAAVFNCRLGTIWLRTLTSGLNFNPGYAGRIPLASEAPPAELVQAVEAAVAHKRSLAQRDLTCDDFAPELFAAGALPSLSAWAERSSALALEETVLALEAEARIEQLLRAHFAIEEEAWADLAAELGEPAADLPAGNPASSAAEVAPEDEALGGEGGEGGEEEARTLPAESAIEALARVHGRSPRALLSTNDLPPTIAAAVLALRASLRLSFAQDYLLFTVLRLFGHRWPGDGPERAEPEALFSSGIAPLIAVGEEPTLLDRLRGALRQGLADTDALAQERDLDALLGKPLGRWLEVDFYRLQVLRLGRRPVLLQLQSSKYTSKKKPVFAAMIHAHRLDKDTIPTIRTQYLGPLKTRLETELRGLEAVGAVDRSRAPSARHGEIEGMLKDLRDFDTTLETVGLSGFACRELATILDKEALDPWTSRDGRAPAPASRDAFAAQERRYDPNPDDGVRVNVAPLQKAGLLAADVLAAKDMEKALADRAEWRADERNQCRGGKLTKPGWWPGQGERS